METNDIADAAREALFDHEAWQALAAQNPQALLTWCTDTIVSVQTQLASRRATWEAFQAAGHPEEVLKREEEFYLGWRSRANRFRIKCQERRRHLRATVQDARRADLAVAYKEALFKLAAAVDDHEHGTISRVELCGVLDSLEVPARAGGTHNLMDAVEAWREHQSATSEQAA